MLHEYAVEPQAIGSSWQTFRYLIEKFGFDKGRLISEFPKKRWYSDVYAAAAALPAVEKKRIEVGLVKAKGRKVVRFRRPYDPNAGDWLHNSLLEHQRVPFKAIIASANGNGDEIVLLADELDEDHPLMAVTVDCAIQRDAASLAAALKEMMRFGSRVLIIDPFFDPSSQRYKSTLRACLAFLQADNPTTICEIHYRHHDDRLSPTDIEREAANYFRGIIPDGITISIHCWRQLDRGEDFHDRFLLTDKGGIMVGAGFSADGAHQTTNMQLMSFDLSQSRLRAFAVDAGVYDLVEPVLVVHHDGRTERK